MALLSSTARTQALRTLGFRGNQATMIKNFQRGWNLGKWLVVDGLYGPNTDAALKKSLANHKAGRGDMSAHFSFGEFQCKCEGRFSSCQGVWENRVHVKRLEVLRAKIGTLKVVSGCRCVGHNKSVGGATSSQHLFGVSSDVPGQLTISQMKALKQFAGIGYSQSTGKVLHVDSRDLGGHNLTNGTPSNPTIWRYA